jgi:hypothetical protein
MRSSVLSALPSLKEELSKFNVIVIIKSMSQACWSFLGSETP